MKYIILIANIAIGWPLCSQHLSEHYRPSKIHQTHLSTRSQEMLIKLAKKFAPEIREHHREHYFLGSVEWFLKHAGLMLMDGKDSIVLIPPGQVTIKKLDMLYVGKDGKQESVMQKTGDEGVLDDLLLYIPEDKYMTATDEMECEPKAYTYARFIDDGEYIDISYIFFSSYNGSAGSNFVLIKKGIDAFGIGHHQGDFEHITVRVNTYDETIEGIFFSAHSRAEGHWYFHHNEDYKSFHGYKLSPLGQPIAWCAKDTHGMYNRPGIIKRCPPIPGRNFIKSLGILVDKTSNQGAHTDCRDRLEIFDPKDPKKSHPWLRFRGYWGKRPEKLLAKKGPCGPIFKEWWTKEPDPESPGVAIATDFPRE